MMEAVATKTSGIILHLPYCGYFHYLEVESQHCDDPCSSCINSRKGSNPSFMLQLFLTVIINFNMFIKPVLGLVKGPDRG